MSTTSSLKYFQHYATHTYYVVLAWKAICCKLCEHGFLTPEEFAIINKSIAWHDQSKMSLEEWSPYANRFFGECTAQALDSFREAVKKHKEGNYHHYESLRNYHGNDWRCYVVELVCDYIAMGWEFEKSFVLEYYDSVSDKMELPDEYKDYLDRIMNLLRDPSMDFVEKPLSFSFESSLIDVTVLSGNGR